MVAGLGVTGVANATPTASKASKATEMRAELHRLRVCESGDHYHLNTGNGYFGAYQFSASTWHALGYAGRPDRAKAATQNAAARKEHNATGWSAWPSCSSREHLR
jgi:resuscitation-promoting factor RpfA